MRIFIQLLFCFLIFISAGSTSHACDTQSLKTFFDDATAIAKSLVSPGDKAVVLEVIALYPEGGEPPRIIADTNGEPIFEIPSKAAAFFVAGVEAVSVDNKLVAGWCFLEASKRNPSDPDFLNNTAFIILQYDLLPSARMILECVNEFAPDYIPSYVNLGYTLDQLSDPIGAAFNYMVAYLKRPTDSDYLYLSANAFARAGQVDIAAGLALTGLENFPGDYDWDPLVDLGGTPSSVLLFDTTTIQSDASAGNCSPEQSIAYGELVSFINEDLARAHRQLGELSSIQIERNCSDCRQHWINENRQCCRENDEAFHIRCECAFLTNEALCLVEKAGAYLEHAVTANALFVQYASSASNIIAAMADGSKDRLCPRDYNNLMTESELWRSILSNPTLFDFSWEIQNIMDEIAMHEEITGFYCSDLGPDYAWVPIAYITTSMNQDVSQCVGSKIPICANINIISGSPALLINFFLFSGKISRDPITGDSNLSVGIGRTYGALNTGGGVTFKYSVNQVSIAPKVSVGGMDMEAVIGFERIEAPDLPLPSTDQRQGLSP